MAARLGLSTRILAKVRHIPVFYLFFSYYVVLLQIGYDTFGEEMVKNFKEQNVSTGNARDALIWHSLLKSGHFSAVF